MAMQFDPSHYQEPLLFLATAAIIAPLFRKIRISPVIGFLAAGAALGPYGFGRIANDYPFLRYVTIANVERAGELADLGVVFLLFMIGLELSWERLVRMRRLVFGLGGAQMILTTLIFMQILHAKFSFRLGPAFVSAAALAMSSTAIAIPVLAERNRLRKASGRAAFSILLFQDLMVAPLLFIIPLLAARAAPVSAWDLFETWAPAMIALMLLALGGRVLLRPLFHLVASAGSRELFMAACLLVVVGASVATGVAGLSMGLGAFIGGLLLAETEFRREIEVTIEPFQGLLLGLFFLSTGAGMDLALIGEKPFSLIGGAFGLITIKAAAVYVLGRAFSLPGTTAAEAALVLAPGGEFAFLMIGAALSAKLLDASFAADLQLDVTLSMLAIPALGAFGARLAPTTKATERDFGHLAPAGVVADEKVVIIGYGRVGALIGEMLSTHGVAFVAVDGSAKLVAEGRESGANIYWGNATRAEFLVRIGLGQARALVVTMDAPKAVEQVVILARKLRPDIPIVARARDAEHATHLYELGVTDATPETIEASLQLAEALLVDIGVPMGYVLASIHEKRDQFKKFMQPHGERSKAKRLLRTAKRGKDFSRPKANAKSNALDIEPADD